MARTARTRQRPGLGIRGVVILAGVIALLIGWVYVSRHDTAVAADVEASESILRHIPPGAMLVATLDVAALRNTDLGKHLLGQGRSVAGLGDVATLCGSDPMDTVDHMAVAIPDAAQDTGFGLFATGALKAHQLIDCAETIVSKRGGRPVRVSSGRFTVLRDASLELSSAELAAADGGPVILAEPSYVRAALGVDPSSSIYTDNGHAELRKLVPPGQLVATAVLSAEQRRALIDELKAQNQAESPFRSVTGAAFTMTVDKQLQLAVVLRCDDPAACSRVAEHVATAAKSEADTEAARAIGLNLVVDRMRIEMRGDAVHLQLTMPADEALSMLRHALLLRKLANQPRPEDREPPPPDDGEPPPPEDGDAPPPESGVGDAGVRFHAKPAPSAQPKD